MMDEKKVNILLVSIGKSYKYSNAGIDLLAGYLRNKKYNVEILYFHMKESLNEIMESIPLTYDVYGFSVYQSNYLFNLKIAQFLKNNNINSIIWGGAFPSMYYLDILKETDNVDYIVLGDGEKPFEYIIEHLSRNKEIEHESIATKNSYENKKNAVNSIIDYLPVDDYYKKVKVENNIEKIHCIQTKNNICTGNCTFCYERKGSIKYKDIDIIVKEIEYIHKMYGVRKFFFSDDNLLDPNDEVAKKRVMKLCKAIKSINEDLVFTCYIKAISFMDTEFDNQVLSDMRKTGFTSMFIGIESGNEEDLLLYNKKTTVNDNIRIINLLNQNDIIPIVGFINVNPYTTVQKLKDNYYFLTNINSNNLFSYGGSFMQLSKGTKMYEMAMKDNLISNDTSLLDGYSYDFFDKDVKSIVVFLRDEFKPRLLNLKVETSWLLQRVKDCTIYCQEAKKHIHRLEEIKKQELEVIKEFFYNLYIKQDVNYCREYLNVFFEFFERNVPELQQILDDVNIAKYGVENE